MFEPPRDAQLEADLTMNTHERLHCRKIACVLTAGAALAVLAVASIAQDYPTKPIRFIVPFPAGGGADVGARLIGRKLSESLGQPIIFDNRVGASGVLGADVASKSRPDGYTLLWAETGILAINPGIYKALPYRPIEDFDPISLALTSPLLLVVDPALRINSVADLIALAKARSTLNYSSSGNGSPQHLAMEWFKYLTGTNLTHIPYKGTASFDAVIAKEVSVTFGSVLGLLPFVRAGRVTPIAITSQRRSRLFADLPTLAEAGVTGFEIGYWYGALAPRGTPPKIIAKLSSLIALHVNSSEMKERFTQDGVDVVGSTSEQFAALIRSELKKWSEIVKISGAKVD